jgi:hypothetical protein
MPRVRTHGSRIPMNVPGFPLTACGNDGEMGLLRATRVGSPVLPERVTQQRQAGARPIWEIWTGTKGRVRMGDESVFFAAVEGGDEATVESMLAAEPDLVRARNRYGATALHLATFAWNRAMVARLLGAGADLNARDLEYGATPAGWAIHLLRERGALLGLEIEDAVFAIERGDALWLSRMVTRHPALRTANDRDGRPLARHPRVHEDPALAAVFAAPEPE